MSCRNCRELPKKVYDPPSLKARQIGPDYHRVLLLSATRTVCLNFAQESRREIDKALIGLDFSEVRKLTVLCYKFPTLNQASAAVVAPIYSLGLPGSALDQFERHGLFCVTRGCVRRLLVMDAGLWRSVGGD